MKKVLSTIAIVASSLFASAATANTVNTTGFTHYLYDNSWSNWYVGLDYIYFSTTGGVTSFTMTADGATDGWDDTYIYLFGDDGSLSTADYIAANDDYNGLDSYLSRTLSAGNYILMVGGCCQSYTAAGVVQGYQSNNSTPSLSLYTIDNTWAYNAAITGSNIVVNSVVSHNLGTLPAVPAPAGLPLLGSALVAAAVLRRKRKS